MDLYEYIIKWTFSEEYQKDFDVILDEESMKNLWMDFDLDGAVMNYIKDHQKILILLDSLHISTLLPLIKILASDFEKHLVVINCNAWINGFVNKYIPDMQDIEQVWGVLQIWEPFDFHTFKHILNFKWSHYIRINQKNIEENVFGDFDVDLLMKGKLLDMRVYDFVGNTGTILFFGNEFSEIINVWNVLKEHQKEYDIFCALGYDFECSIGFQESLKKTKKLLVILDQSPQSWYTHILQKKLAEKGIKDIVVKFITPHIDILTTNLSDYIREQAHFDSQWILEQLIAD